MLAGDHEDIQWMARALSLALAAALGVLGARGLTHVVVDASDPLARMLPELGLVDRSETSA